MCQATSPSEKGDKQPDKDVVDHVKKCSTFDEDGSINIAQRTLQEGTLLSCVSLLLLVTGASLTFPHMQSQRDKLGCDSLCYGSMTSVRGALGLVGTALIGRLSDKNGTILARTLGRLSARKNSNTAIANGRRACLYVGTVASVAGFVIAATMDSLQGLWLSMIPGALLQHNFDVFKALLSEYHNDIDQIQSKNEETLENDAKKGDQRTDTISRSGSVGKLGMVAGISFMVGPMISAFATKTFQSATILAIIFTLASGLTVYLLPLPVLLSDMKPIGEKNNTLTSSTNSEFTLTNMLKLKTTKARAAMTLLVLRLNMALAFHIFNTIWPASLKTRFHFGPSEHAMFMSFIGVVYAFSQGFVAKRVIQFCGSERKVYVIMSCCAILGAGRYVAYYTSSIHVMYSSFLFIINALGILNTVITADTGSIAPSNELGGLFGALQASESAAGMLGPFLGGVISYYFGEDGVTGAPLMAVLAIYAFLFLFVYWGYEKFVIRCNYTKDIVGISTSDDSNLKKTM